MCAAYVILFIALQHASTNRRHVGVRTAYSHIGKLCSQNCVMYKIKTCT
jgi:hypothetical protein